MENNYNSTLNEFLDIGTLDFIQNNNNFAHRCVISLNLLFVQQIPKINATLLLCGPVNVIQMINFLMRNLTLLFRKVQSRISRKIRDPQMMKIHPKEHAKFPFKKRRVMG